MCVGLEEDLKMIVGHFGELCRRTGLKVKAGKNKMVALGGKEGLECDIYVDGICLEHVLEIKYLGCFRQIRY